MNHNTEVFKQTLWQKSGLKLLIKLTTEDWGLNIHSNKIITNVESPTSATQNFYFEI